MTTNDLTKADPKLLDAIRSGPANESLCVILLLKSGPTLPELPMEGFPTRQAWQQAMARRSFDRIREAVQGTLEELRQFGLDPQGWELGQAVIYGTPQQIRQALAVEGVVSAVLDFEMKLFDDLVETHGESGPANPQPSAPASPAPGPTDSPQRGTSVQKASADPSVLIASPQPTKHAGSNGVHYPYPAERSTPRDRKVGAVSRKQLTPGQRRRVATCTVIKPPKDDETAALLRLLYNRLADDRPGGRRSGRQPIKVGDKRTITLKGPRIPSLLMFLARLEAAGVLAVSRQAAA